MAEDARYEFEQCDGRRLRFYAGQPGKYVGVTERKGKFKNSFYACACVTKHKGDKRRQYSINGAFASAKAAAIAIADAEACPLGPPSPEGDRKPRTCALCPLPSPCPLLMSYALLVVSRMLAAKSIHNELGIDLAVLLENAGAPQLLAQTAAQPPHVAALALPLNIGNLRPESLLPVVVQPQLIPSTACTDSRNGAARSRASPIPGLTLRGREGP